MPEPIPARKGEPDPIGQAGDVGDGLVRLEGGAEKADAALAVAGLERALAGLIEDLRGVAPRSGNEALPAPGRFGGTGGDAVDLEGVDAG